MNEYFLAKSNVLFSLVAGMMVVPQLGPSAGFQQVVGHSPATSGHGTTTALLLTHTQDARELQIARPTTATPAQQPVTQVQVAGTLPGNKTIKSAVRNL